MLIHTNFNNGTNKPSEIIEAITKQSMACPTLQYSIFFICIVYVLRRRSNTQSKTEKSPTAVGHWTNRSHTAVIMREYQYIYNL